MIEDVLYYIYTHIYPGSTFALFLLGSENGDDLNTEIAFFLHEDAVILPITVEWQREVSRSVNTTSEFSESIE